MNTTVIPTYTVAQIPLRSDIFQYFFQITLSNVVYKFTVRYNGRMDRWILNIDDISGNQILSGIPLLININLLSQYPTLNILSGNLYCIDNSQKFIQPTQFSFGYNNFLVYLS
jgi:hypothetical protein